MARYELHAEPLMLTVSIGTPPLTVVRAQNPLVAEFQRGPARQNRNGAVDQRRS